MLAIMLISGQKQALIVQQDHQELYSLEEWCTKPASNASCHVSCRAACKMFEMPAIDAILCYT